MAVRQMIWVYDVEYSCWNWSLWSNNFLTVQEFACSWFNPGNNFECLNSERIHVQFDIVVGDLRLKRIRIFDLISCLLGFVVLKNTKTQSGKVERIAVYCSILLKISDNVHFENLINSLDLFIIKVLYSPLRHSTLETILENG